MGDRRKGEGLIMFQKHMCDLLRHFVILYPMQFSACSKNTAAREGSSWLGEASNMSFLGHP